MADPTAPPVPTTPPPPAAPPAGPARRLTPLVAGLIGVVLGAGIVGGAWIITANSGPSKPGTFTLGGGFELTDSVVPDGNGGCAGESGYDDIRDGTSVTVYNAAGAVVATGSLTDSKYDEDTFNCDFTVSVPDVPKGEKFYKVEVSHRGTLQLAAQEAENGEFSGTLG